MLPLAASRSRDGEVISSKLARAGRVKTKTLFKIGSDCSLARHLEVRITGQSGTRP
jgi:hypothetical protein